MTIGRIAVLVLFLAFGPFSVEAQTPVAPSPDNSKSQEKGLWYNAGLYSFNLINIEYYDLDRKDLHFSGQRQDLRNEWAGLADALKNAQSLGFVQIGNKFVNLRNLSSMLGLGSGRGGSLTFRDGATLQISGTELDFLIRMTR
jgi:hypothetical protein